MVNKMFAYFNVNDNVIYQKLVVYSSMSSSSSSSSSPILLFLVYGRLEVMAGISPSPWTNELRYINNGCQSSPQLKLNYHSRFWNNRRNMSFFKSAYHCINYTWVTLMALRLLFVDPSIWGQLFYPVSRACW